MMITLLGAPFILPVIVAIFGLLAVFGRTGLFSQILASFGVGPLNIYGFQGIVLAHVFFNLPLATRLILRGWQTIPAEHFRLAAQLSLESNHVFRHLERPMLRGTLPGAFAVIFLLSAASFAVALALGGGPKATTVELAIYQAFRFDFDLGKAAFLALVQLALSATAALVAWKFTARRAFDAGFGRRIRRWDGLNAVSIAQDIAVLSCAALFLFLPLSMVVLRGVAHLNEIPAPVFPAIVRSLIVAVVSAGLAVFLALILARAALDFRKNGKSFAGWIESVGFLTLATSPMVIGAGLFILLFRFFSPSSMALPVTITVNAALSLPFALYSILPALRDAEAHYGRLADSLGMRGVTRFRLAIWPRIRPSVGFAAGLSAALSMGDLGVIALFADADNATLPLVMYRLMAGYQMDAASAVALLLLALSLALFWLFDRGGRLNAAT